MYDDDLVLYDEQLFPCEYKKLIEPELNLGSTNSGCESVSQNVEDQIYCFDFSSESYLSKAFSYKEEEIQEDFKQFFKPVDFHYKPYNFEYLNFEKTLDSMRNMSSLPQEIPMLDSSKKIQKKRERFSASQNYIGIITRAFARKILSKEGLAKLSHFDSKIKGHLIEYLTKNLQGKKPSNDSAKVNNHKEFIDVFFPKIKDSDETVLIKNYLQEQMKNFMDYPNFRRWIEDRSECRCNLPNKVWLLKNRAQIAQLFAKSIEHCQFISPNSDELKKFEDTNNPDIFISYDNNN